MYTSIAIDGPRNGIKLCAPGTWDGMIRKATAPSHAQASKYFYPGRYIWSPNRGWVWHPGKFKLMAAYRPDSTRNWYLVLE